MVEHAMTAGCRRCRHCTLPFQPPADLVVIPERAGARAVCGQCNTWTPGDPNGDGSVIMCRVCAARGRHVRLSPPARARFVGSATSIAQANLTRAVDAGDSDDLERKFELLISGPELSQLSAWVEGFCSRACMHGHALDVVAKRAAWWLKHQPREGAA